MGAGPEPSRKPDWTAAIVAALILGPVVCTPLGFAFGLLVVDSAVAARLSGSFYGIARIGGALMGALGMGSGSMLGGLVGGAMSGWGRGRRASAALLGGMVAGLLAGLALGAAQNDPLALFRDRWSEVFVDVSLIAVAGGVGGIVGAAMAQAFSRAIRRKMAAS